MATGENIKRIRKKKGLTQKELGIFLNVSQSMIAAYENGVRKPKTETISKIAKALDVSMLDILDFDEWKQFNREEHNQEFEKLKELDDSVLILLHRIYGKVEEKDFSPGVPPYYESLTYYAVGEENEQFYLYGDDIDNLNTLITNVVRNAVDMVKSDRPETEKELKESFLEEIKKPDHAESIKAWLRKRAEEIERNDTANNEKD